MPFLDPQRRSHPTRLDLLQVAFAIRIARRIVDADGVLDLSEIELLVRTFPDPFLHDHGFLDADRSLTPLVDRRFREALAELPGALTMTEKLDLVTLFHRTCEVDGQLHPREIEVLHEAAAMLEVPRATLDRHLEDLAFRATIVPVERSVKRR